MPERVEVDPSMLRAQADRARRAADDIGDIDRATIDLDGLPGSAVAARCTGRPLDGRLGELGAALRGWAAAVDATADALAGSDHAAAQRLPAT
jgi:hypothetical protein